jgi:hypothetical protein
MILTDTQIDRQTSWYTGRHTRIFADRQINLKTDIQKASVPTVINRKTDRYIN